jgi:hypothetical protein
MIGRADIEGSKSNVAMSAWLPQASYPCGNFSDTSTLTRAAAEGSIGRAFAVPARTGRRDQASICPFARQEISVLSELALGHLRYGLTNVPPQPNSPPGCFWSGPSCMTVGLRHRNRIDCAGSGISRPPELPPMLHPANQSKHQTRVKLNRVFFPR